jgi:hypothetical protein
MGPINGFGRFNEDKTVILLSGNKPRFLGHPVSSLVNTPNNDTERYGMNLRRYLISGRNV